MEGEGNIRQTDGAKFKGTFKGGKKEGYGILVDTDGIRYEGNFHNDLKDGEFVEKDKSGNVIRKVTYVSGMAKPNTQQ